MGWSERVFFAHKSGGMEAEPAGFIARLLWGGKRLRRRSCACENFLRSSSKVFSQLRTGAAFPATFGDRILRLRKCTRVVRLVYLGFSSIALAAQQPSPQREQRFTLQEAVEFARAHYPEARA